MSPYHWPVHEIGAEAERLYIRENLTTDQVGRRLHVSGTTVRAALRNRGVSMRPAGRHGRHVVPIGRCTLAARLKDSGLTFAQVAERLGTSQSTAYRLVNRGRKAITDA